jgi:hypothetical protein
LIMKQFSPRSSQSAFGQLFGLLQLINTIKNL